jgi:hypothetical protein
MALAAHRASAAEPEANVFVALAGPAAAVAAVREALVEPLSRAEVVARYAVVPAPTPGAIREAGSDPRLLAAAVIDLQPGRDAVVYLVDVRAGRVLVRRVAAPWGTDAVAVEELAHIVAVSFRALKAGGRLGEGDEVAELAARPAAVAAPPSRALLVGLGLAGLVESWSSERVLVPAVAASLLLGSRASRWRNLWMMGGAGATSVVDDPITLRMWSAGLAVLGLVRIAGVAPGPARAWLGLGPGLDLVHAGPSAGQRAGAEALQASLQAAPLARGALRGDLRATRRLVLYLALGCDLLLVKPRYLVSRQGRDQVMFEPWRLRPMLVLGAETPLAREDLR